MGVSYTTISKPSTTHTTIDKPSTTHATVGIPSTSHTTISRSYGYQDGYFLLNEDGGYLLNEDGGRLVLESAPSLYSGITKPSVPTYTTITKPT